MPCYDQLKAEMAECKDPAARKRARNKAFMAKYTKTDIYKEKRRAYQGTKACREKQKAYMAKYMATATYKENHLAYAAKYRASALFRATRAAYIKTKVRKEYEARRRVKRRAYLKSLLDPTTFSREIERCRTEMEKLRLCQLLVAAWRRAKSNAPEVLQSLKEESRRRTNSPR